MKLRSCASAANPTLLSPGSHDATDRRAEAACGSGLSQGGVLVPLLFPAPAGGGVCPRRRRPPASQGTRTSGPAEPHSTSVVCRSARRRACWFFGKAAVPAPACCFSKGRGTSRDLTVSSARHRGLLSWLGTQLSKLPRAETAAVMRVSGMSRVMCRLERTRGQKHPARVLV